MTNTANDRSFINSSASSPRTSRTARCRWSAAACVEGAGRRRPCSDRARRRQLHRTSGRFYPERADDKARDNPADRARARAPAETRAGISICRNDSELVSASVGM